MYRGVMPHDPEEWSKNWKKKTDLFQKWQEFVEVWLEHSKVWKIYTLNGCYCAKYLMFDLKKNRGVILHDNEEWCKIWIKTNLWFGKWHEEFCKFSRKHLKVSKLGVWWGYFVRVLKSLKFTEELWVMIMKNDAKFEGKLTYAFKNGMGNSANLQRLK